MTECALLNYLIELELELIKPWTQARNTEHLPSESRQVATKFLGLATSEKG